MIKIRDIKHIQHIFNFNSFHINIFKFMEKNKKDHYHRLNRFKQKAKLIQL